MRAASAVGSLQPAEKSSPDSPQPEKSLRSKEDLAQPMNKQIEIWGIIFK